MWSKAALEQLPSPRATVETLVPAAPLAAAASPAAAQS
jgi:hypothetical protein